MDGGLSKEDDLVLTTRGASKEMQDNYSLQNGLTGASTKPMFLGS